eukprot:g1246.t1
MDEHNAFMQKNVQKAGGVNPTDPFTAVMDFCCRSLWVVLLFILYSDKHKQTDCSHDLDGVDFYMYLQLTGWISLGAGVYGMVRRVAYYYRGYGQEAQDAGIAHEPFPGVVTKLDNLFLVLLTLFSLTWNIFGAVLFFQTEPDRDEFESENCYNLHQFGYYWYLITFSIAAGAIAIVCCCVCCMLATRGG